MLTDHTRLHAICEGVSGVKETVVQFSSNACVGINNPHVFLFLWSSPPSRRVTVIEAIHSRRRALPYRLRAPKTRAIAEWLKPTGDEQDPVSQQLRRNWFQFNFWRRQLATDRPMGNGTLLGFYSNFFLAHWIQRSLAWRPRRRALATSH